MRYAGDHKAVTRTKILAEAAVELRRHGPAGLSIARVMKQAGLTHGGFYFHFASKDDLLAGAIDHMFARQSADMFATTEDRRTTLDRLIAAYLSRRHRDHPEQGCPLPILAGEESRLPPLARDRFREGVERVTRTVAELLDTADSENSLVRARWAVAEMVGAVALARMLDGEPSQALLRMARASVRAKLGLR